MLTRITESQWSRLSGLVAQTMGLHFPRERWDDLQRGLAGAAHEFGFDDTAACVGWLLSALPTQAQLQVLASHLTIGETYFFRDAPTLDALAQNILPALIRSRRRREQRLRLWSAACCSGEEAYSLAILLHQLLPDLHDWHVTITATDINPRFLHKAVAGVYGEWSFRNAPAGLKERYFTRTPSGRFAILPAIKTLVTFAHLNLVEDAYPSLATDTNAMDVILCRNVLMYFTAQHVRKVIANLHHSLVEGGLLAVSPCEASQALFTQFAAVNFPAVTLYRKDAEPARSDPAWAPAPFGDTTKADTQAFETPAPWAAQAPAETPPAPRAVAESLYQEGSYSQVVDTLLAAGAAAPADAAAYSLLARALANQGKLAEALAWCERWLAADKLDPAGHYLRAVVLLEQGDTTQARASLQRSVYLDHGFVLAHFALGNLARSRSRHGEANKHFANAANLLRSHRPEDLLPESDGLTAGRLAETLATIVDTVILQ